MPYLFSKWIKLYLLATELIISAISKFFKSLTFLNSLFNDIAYGKNNLILLLEYDIASL